MDTIVCNGAKQLRDLMDVVLLAEFNLDGRSGKKTPKKNKLFSSILFGK